MTHLENIVRRNRNYDGEGIRSTYVPIYADVVRADVKAILAGLARAAAKRTVYVREA